MKKSPSLVSVLDESQKEIQEVRKNAQKVNSNSSFSDAGHLVGEVAIGMSVDVAAAVATYSEKDINVDPILDAADPVINGYYTDEIVGATVEAVGDAGEASIKVASVSDEVVSSGLLDSVGDAAEVVVEGALEVLGAVAEGAVELISSALG